MHTKAKVAECLRQLDLEVHEGVGVVGILRVGTGNRAIVLHAYLDALPILETSVPAYPSNIQGTMHACGHDGHMTMLLGAVDSLAATRDFSCTVVFLFQPNEEHGLGARAMIEGGVVDRFSVYEICAIQNLPGAPLCQVVTRVGLFCSSESLFEIKISGQGGHASMPQTGRDAITVGAEIEQSLQTIVSRKLEPGAGAVVSVTKFATDGQRNVLPGHATPEGDTRVRSTRDRDRIEIFMRQIAQGVAYANDVTVDAAFGTDCIETMNAPAPVRAAIRAAQTAGLDVLEDCSPMSFSEDFAHFSAAAPGCFLLLRNGETGPHAWPLHASDYDFNEGLSPIGAAFRTALLRDRIPLQEQKGA